MIWPQACLGELCDIVVGRTPARARADFWGPGAPWLSISDMNQGRVIHRTKEQITEAGARGGKSVAPGTVLLSFKLSLGKVARAGIPLYTNEAIAALPIRDDDRLDSGYLVWFLDSLNLMNYSNRAAMGATLNRRQLSNLVVPLPPLPEQRRIAAILDGANQIRDKRSRARESLGELANSVFHEMFGDTLANPNGWPIAPLAEWVATDRPITYGILKPGPDVPGGVPYVRVADMKDRGIALSGVRRTSKEIAKEYARSKLCSDDLLVSIRGHVGRFAFVPKELDGANITQDSARLSVAPYSSAVYVRAAMESESVQRWLKRRTKGAAVQGINLGELRRLPLPHPPNAMLERHAEVVANIQRQRQRTVEQANGAESLFASLQARAFRGEL